MVSLIPSQLKGISHARRLIQSARLPSRSISRGSVIESKGIVNVNLGSVIGSIPPFILGHRVCGRVVKRDPVTGKEYPVPGAKVNVVDVDFNLYCWCPWLYWPYCWFYPFFIRREVIATTTTDQCGNFCVTIPWFDIDYCWHWRLKYHCLPQIFKKPSVLDAIELGVKPDMGIYKGIKSHS